MSLAAGAEIWIVENRPSYWWKQIDFHSGFLLSRLAAKDKMGFVHAQSLQTQKIVKLTELPSLHFKESTSVTFIGSQNHFLNKWICLVYSLNELEKPKLYEQFINLGCKDLRVFTDDEKMDESTEPIAGLKARFSSVEVISSP